MSNFGMIERIDEMNSEGFCVEEIAEKLGDSICVTSFREMPEWCHEDADCHECWCDSIKIELDK